MNKNVIYLFLLYCSLILNVKCLQQSIYEEFNNKQISLSNTLWNCEDPSIKPTKTFSCSKGVDLMPLEKVDQVCHNIQNTINTKLPHFEIQLYIDVQGNNSIDDYECISIQVTDQLDRLQICLNSKYNSTFGSSLYCLQDEVWKYQLRQTQIIQTTHSSENIQIQISANCDQDFSDESYSFRNIQLFVIRCYKTCKTCSGERKDQCKSCYDNIVMNGNTCKSCKDQRDKQFLQIPGGCRDNCKQNYSFDEEFVCQEDIYVQKSCQESCQLCTNTQYCLQCQEQKYLHSGQCITQCPDYTKIEGKNCLNSIDILKKQNIKILEQVKEFYDLSTTNSKIKQLFTFISKIGESHFLKGATYQIKEYLEDHLYGTMLNFDLITNGHNKSNILQYFLKSFWVTLNQIQTNQIIKQIMNHNKLQLYINKCIQIDPDIEDQNWPSDYKYNKYNVDVSFSYKQQTSLLTTIDLECLGLNQFSFCAIQNFNIVGFSECIQGYKFDQFNYERKSTPASQFAEINQKLKMKNVMMEMKIHLMDVLIVDIIVKNFVLIVLKQEQIVNKLEMNINYEQSYDLDMAQFSCIFQCSFCINNQCMQYNYGYYLNPYTNLCLTICGDFIQQSYEQCDDYMIGIFMINYNINDYDGCSNCQLIQYEKCDQDPEIIKHHCQVCFQGKCLKCNDGLLLDGDVCISVCGDGLINVQEEECDTEYEGCEKCKIMNGYICGKLPFSTCSTCDKECKKCTNLDGINLICLSCIDGYYAVEDKCLKCDQNCINCNLQSNLCTSCFREDCDFCESTPGLFADIKIKKCNSICGDGIQVQFYEQCDDHNLKNGDGCDSQCNLEYLDDEFNKFKDCQFKGNNTYDLTIKQSSDLNLLCNTQCQYRQHRYSILQLQLLSFEFTKSVYKFNIIHVKLNYIRANQIYRQILSQDKINEYYIPPNENTYLDQNQISQKYYIQSVQESFSFFFLIMIPISILLNLFNCLWAVLEILSWINNFYFLNVNYPFNVEIFFLKSDWSSFVSLPTYQGLNQPDSNYYFEAPKRFKEKGIDPLFFNNIQTPFMFIAFSLLLYSINYICYQFFYFLNDVFKQKIIIKVKQFSIFNIQIIQKVKKQPNKENHKVQIKSNFYLQFITQTFKQHSTHLINQFKQTIQLCLLDIKIKNFNSIKIYFIFKKKSLNFHMNSYCTLAIQLQLSFSNGSSNIIVGFNSFFAIITIGVIIFQLYRQYQPKVSTLKIYMEFIMKILILKNNMVIIIYTLDKQVRFYTSILWQITIILLFFKLVYVIYLALCAFYFYFMIIHIILKSNLLQNQYPIFVQAQLFQLFYLFSMNDQITIKFIEQNKVILGWLIISLVIFAIFVEFCILVAGILMYLFSIFKMIQNLIKKVFNNNRDSIQQHQQKQQLQITKKIKNKIRSV
ncbi:unnamed protein product [Paramecium sonneborni]|uniref:Transmembrane protein n=1 Tax=Paramecium sonneborni TaxID=65129 RepID=A0A8S1QWI8_9CILI|nr:unnamed protein product [Paramecium sonneborni]